MSRDPAVTSRIMSAVRSRDTGPELRLRRELHRRGLRYRVHRPLVGRPDIVFARARVAVFVDGDFWHGNTWRLRGASSLAEYLDGRGNAAFWHSKISATIARDETVTRQLSEQGWRVLRLWESDLDRNLAAAADLVEGAVRGTARTVAATSHPPAAHGA